MGLNQESRTVNAGKNAASALCNKICVLLLTFISRKVFIQYIGVAYLGINGLFSNILTLLSMADLGLGTAMNVSLYRPIAENDMKRLSALLNYFKRLYTLIAFGVTIAGLGLIPFLKYIVNMESHIPHLYVYYMIFVLKNTASYLFIYKAAIINADQKNYLVNRIELYVSLGKVLAQIILVITLRSYLLYCLLEVAVVLVHNLIVSSIANRTYPFLGERNQLERAEKKAIFKDISDIFLYKIAWSLLNGTDNILMSVLVGTVSVGLYSNYYTVTFQLEAFIALLFTSMTAGVGNLIATAQPQRRYQVFQMMQMISFWICGIVTVSLWYLLQDFIQLWVGPELLLDQLTVIAIIINMFFSVCMRPVWTFREGTGMYRQIRYVMVVTAVLNLIFSIVLGNLLGISGILFATSLSKAATYFWYEPKILFQKFFQQKARLFYMDYMKNTLLLVSAGALCYIPIRCIKGSALTSWLIKAVICLAVVNTLYYLRYRRTKEFLLFRSKVRGLINKRDKNHGSA